MSLKNDLGRLLDMLPEPSRRDDAEWETTEQLQDEFARSIKHDEQRDRVTIERMCIRKLKWKHDPDWPHVWQAPAFLGRDLVVRSNPNNEAAPYEFRVGTVVRTFKTLDGAQQAAQEHFENIVLEQLEAPQ